MPLLILAFSALFQQCVSQGLVKENGQLVGGPLSLFVLLMLHDDAALALIAPACNLF